MSGACVRDARKQNTKRNQTELVRSLYNGKRARVKWYRKEEDDE